MIADFWALTPEANSFRLLAGAGPAAHAPELAAYEALAVTHTEQATQQATTAAATSVSWQGSGGTGMMSTAAPLSAWNAFVGGVAHKAVATLGGLTAAYTGAVASSAHYSIPIANRIREAVLQSTNFLGINAIPIAETDAEYTGYWAQNAAASTGYEVQAVPLMSMMSIPLTPSPLGANPVGMAAEAVGLGVQAAGTAAHALGAGLTQGLSAASQAAGMATGVATSTATELAAQAPAAAQSPGASSGGSQGTGAAPDPASAKPPGDQEFFSAAQSMSGSMMQAPTQAVQAATGSLGQGGQMFSGLGQVGSLGSGLMNPAMLGGAGLNSPAVGALSAGSGAAPGVLGGNGGFAGGGGGAAVSAALTKPMAGGPMAGTVGLPGNWWGQGDKVPVAGASETTPGGLRGGPAAGAPGMYGGMAPAAAGAGARGRSGSRDLSEADKQVLTGGGIGEGMPVFTDDGIVYASGQGV